jgi:hypothetical protein
MLNGQSLTGYSPLVVDEKAIGILNEIMPIADKTIEINYAAVPIDGGLTNYFKKIDCIAYNKIMLELRCLARKVNK